MKSSKQDKAEGTFHEVRGKVREVAGKVSDNPELETKEYKMSGKPPFTTLHPVSHDPVGNKAFSLVSPDWVAAHFNEPDLRIIDVRPVHDYLAAHVPNAVHIPEAAIQSSRGSLPAQYIDPPEMAALFGRAGIGADTRVVLYSSGEDVLGATVMAYSLQRIGHRHIMVMDGGVDDYRLRHPMTQIYPNGVEPQTLPGKLDKTLFITHQDVLAALDKPGVVLLDARPAHYYLGNSHQWMRNGHILGAISFDWHQLTYHASLPVFQNAHRFKPVDAMRELVAATGITKADDIIVYCGTSREASLLFETIKNLLGYPKVRLYEGSMTEWSALSQYPIETAGKLVQPTPRSATTTGE